MFDIEDSLEWKVSPLTIIDTEARFPGLFDDLSIEAWQRHLIADQVKGTTNNDDG